MHPYLTEEEIKKVSDVIQEFVSLRSIYEKGRGFIMNFAIIGCGFIAKKHAAAIDKIDAAKLVAVCDKVPATRISQRRI
jgi:ornithine cyclodeaminase/alanine dehydrogenase-like protein (mu-crystallin family)